MGLSNPQFVGETGLLLDRLGSALSASAGSRFEPEDWAAADVVGASFTDAWRIFSIWGQVRDAVTVARERLGARVRRVLPRARPKPKRVRIR
jgi:hypothetical protein